MNCGEPTKKIRLAIRLEQQEIAKLLKVSSAAVSKWERGERIPRIPVVRRYMELAEKHKIKVSIEDFIGEG